VATESTKQTLIEALEELVAGSDHFPEGLVKRLEKQFRVDGQTAEDAVAEGLARMVERADRLEVDDPRAYLTAVATNLMRRAVQEKLPLGYDESFEGDEQEEEDDALGKETYLFIKGIVDRWETNTLRTVTLLVLEGAYVGDPLSGEELTRETGRLLGEEISAATVRQWKKRGLDRLQQELRELGLWD
jgi:DNA-directed RNA polymerase specialized sigma24 family protein